MDGVHRLAADTQIAILPRGGVFVLEPFLQLGRAFKGHCPPFFVNVVDVDPSTELEDCQHIFQI